MFWHYARSRLKTREGIQDLVIDGETDSQGKQKYATSDQEKSEALVKFFGTVYIREPDGPLPETTPVNVGTEFIQEEITQQAVKKLLQKLDPSKAAGPDEVHPAVLKELADVLATPLQTIYKTSLRTGTLPDVWKVAHVTAIHKKKDKSKPSNYRPVSLTAVSCKVMEKLVREWLVDHMKRNNLLSDQQYGFLAGRSTSLQMIKATDDWTSILDEGNIVDVYMWTL